MAKQMQDTDKGRDTVRDQTRFQHVSTLFNFFFLNTPEQEYRQAQKWSQSCFFSLLPTSKKYISAP